MPAATCRSIPAKDCWDAANTAGVGAATRGAASPADLLGMAAGDTQDQEKPNLCETVHPATHEKQIIEQKTEVLIKNDYLNQNGFAA